MLELRSSLQSIAGGSKRLNGEFCSHVHCCTRYQENTCVSYANLHYAGLRSSAPAITLLRGQKPAHLALSSQSFSRWRRSGFEKQYPSRLAVRARTDPELRFVLELASDTELHELSTILYSRSLLSPLVKSLANTDGSNRQDHGELLTDQEERDVLMARLESRFLFLAADAKSTLSGRRPTYRNVLLQVRRKLDVACSSELSTADMESEIFLHLLQQSSRKSVAAPPAPLTGRHAMSIDGKNDAGARHWQSVLPTIVKLRGKEMLSTILKGGGAMTVSSLQRLVFKKLSGKLLRETARYQLAKEAVVKTGQVAAILETRVAVLAAKQGLLGAAKQYITVRSALSVLGPMLWGTLLADVLISSVGTDYARVVRAICAFAQIRLTRAYDPKEIEDMF